MAKTVVDLGKKLGKNLTEDGSELELLSPDGDAIGITLKVKSVLSKDGKALYRRQTEASAKKQARGKTQTQAEIDKANAEMVTTLVIGGDKFKVADREIDPANLSKDDAMLLNKEYPFIMTQITEFAMDSTNFYGALKGN